MVPCRNIRWYSRLSGGSDTLADIEVITGTGKVADYHLATLFGALTAGCNGNANFIPLPGGFRIMWTGMNVRKHDGSPFYTVWFVPNFPVAHMLRAVEEGRDEYLGKAIEVIEASAKPAKRAMPARQS
jgi:hypothetical protein